MNSGASSNFRRSPDTEFVRISADGKSVYKEKMDEMRDSYKCQDLLMNVKLVDEARE